MLLEGEDEKNGHHDQNNGQGRNGAALENSTSNTGGIGGEPDNSDAQSVVSIVAEPVDRMTLLEQQNHRIEMMLSQMMHGGGSALSTVGSGTGNSLNHRKFSNEQTLHENELHGQDHLHNVPSRASQYSNRY